MLTLFSSPSERDTTYSLQMANQQNAASWQSISYEIVKKTICLWGPHTFLSELSESCLNFHFITGSEAIK
jgi:hypothetical protein